MSKGKSVKMTKTTMEQRKPEPSGLNGYRSMSDRAIHKSINQTFGIAITAMFIGILTFILTIINTSLLVSVTENGVSKKMDEWVECTLDNYVGYKVKKDWTALSVETGVAFQPRESEAINAYSQSVRTINKMRDLALTYDTLQKYIESDLAALNAEDNITLSNITHEDCVYLGQNGYEYRFKQEVVNEEGVTVTSYTRSIFFIYEEYLYSFAYVSNASYANTDFDTVLESIRVIPESERPTVVPVEDLDSEWIDKYSDFADEVSTSTTTTNAAPEVSDTTVTETSAETTTTISE